MDSIIEHIIYFVNSCLHKKILAYKKIRDNTNCPDLIIF